MKQSKLHRFYGSSYGFTIVELLIVVVVIAILAAITTVAFTNIQNRANRAKAESAVVQYTKTFELYKFEEGRYPTRGSNNVTVCLGPPDAYPANDDFEEGQCANWSGSSASHFVREDFNDMLQPLVSEILRGDVQTVMVNRTADGWAGVQRFRGVMYHDIEGGENGFINYFLEGTQTCAKGDTYHYDGVTECVLSLNGSPTDDEWGKRGGEGWWL